MNHPEKTGKIAYLVINNNREFQRLFKKGECYVTYGFVCYYLKNDIGKNRMGLVASKKIGNAVFRNRAKRVLRESFRALEPTLRASELRISGASNLPTADNPIDNNTLNSSIASKTPTSYDFIFVSRGKTPHLKSTQVLKLMGDFFKKRLI